MRNFPPGGPASGPAPGFGEPLLAFLVCSGLASALFWLGHAVPFVRNNLHGFIAVVFLYAPAVAARLSGRAFDYRAAGLTLAGWKGGLAAAGLGAAVTWPFFCAAFLVFYGSVCGSDLPSLASFAERFAPLCHRWLGLEGAGLRLPEGFVLLVLSQVLVVALPEEVFFRGYLMARLEARWPSWRTLLGTPVGLPLLVSSAAFAVGHLLVDLDPQRLLVFFPGLAFAFIRARTGSLLAGTLFHAACNLLSDLLHTGFFRGTVVGAMQ